MERTPVDGRAHAHEPAEPRRHRCLLLSPALPLDPESGDVQYTRELLAAPPAGVDYVPYTQALETGELEQGASVKRLREWQGAADVGVSATRLGLHALRASGVLLPDPVRWFRVRGRFDLVHQHCLPVGFVGPHPPLVVGDSSGTWWHWTVGQRRPESRVARQLRLERRIARLLGYAHPTAHPEPGAARILWVETARGLLEQLGVGSDGVVVCPPGTPPPRRRAAGDGRTLLFVAHDFAVKGGDVAVEALRIVRRSRPDVRLIVVGSPLPDPNVDGVEWLGPRTREELYRDVYPQTDVFVYPSRLDSFSLVTVEALGHGIPVVATRSFALPELVREGETGFLVPPDDAQATAAAVERLLADETLRRRFAAEAQRDFERRFSLERRNELLGAVYRAAAAAG